MTEQLDGVGAVLPLKQVPFYAELPRPSPPSPVPLKHQALVSPP